MNANNKIDPSAIVHPSAYVGVDAYISAKAYVGANARISDGAERTPDPATAYRMAAKLLDEGPYPTWSDMTMRSDAEHGWDRAVARLRAEADRLDGGTS